MHGDPAKLVRTGAAATVCALITGCAHSPPTDEELRRSFAAYRSATDRVSEGKPPQLGLALGGGGTRAAATSIGILQGLQEAGLVSHVDVISTVSGGGYGAYWWYSRFLEAGGDSTMLAPFADCVPARYGQYLAVGHSTACAGPSTDDVMPLCAGGGIGFDLARQCPKGDPYRYQNHLRGFQDIFGTGRFEYRTILEDQPDVAVSVGKLLGNSVIAGIPNFVANVLFDRQVDFSPTRKAYRDGIGSTYGAAPEDCSKASPEGRAGCVDSRERSSPAEMSFRDLQRARSLGAPLWVINAYAGTGRSGLDFSSSAVHPEQVLFEFTPYQFGSSVYRYWLTSALAPDFSVLDAVTASAAFFSAQQKVLDPGLRNLVNLAMVLSTVNWGVSIENPNVEDSVRMVHGVLPFPLYYAHHFDGVRTTPYINLADGGLTDNIGAYSLLRRNVEVWILSDHSYDRAGTMSEICKLRKNVETFGWDVLMPGLDLLPSVCEPGSKLGYDIFAWSHPILLGCVVTKGKTDCDDAKARVLLIKPALNARLAFTQDPIPMNSDTTPTVEWRDMADACRAHPRSSECARAALKFSCSNRAPAASRAANKVGAWTFDERMPCEVMGFLMVNGFGHGKAGGDDCPGFPQNSSVLMTANSSGTLFGAYRELARWYARQVGYFFDNGVLARERFGTVLQVQRSSAITPKLATPGNFVAAKAGSPNDCILLEARP